MRLFQELADEGVLRMQIHKLQPSTLICVTSAGTLGGVFTGDSEEGADTSSRNSTGVAYQIFAYVQYLTRLGLSFMAYADVTVYFRRDPHNKTRYDAFLDKTGADANFVVSSVHPSQVGIGWLEIGASANNGCISILMPVRCSVLGCWLRVRYVVSRNLVDTPVRPSDKLCADALAAAQKMAHAPGGLQRLYRESGLVYHSDFEPKGQNGPHAIILGDYNRDQKSIKELRKHLRAGLKYGPEMNKAVEKVLGEVTAAGGAVSVEDIHDAAKAAGFPSVGPNSAFAAPFRDAFDQFLGAVGKKLHKVGCMGSAKTKKGKRAAEESGAGLGTGGKGSGKRGAKKKKKSPYPRGPGQLGQAEHALFR